MQKMRRYVKAFSKEEKKEKEEFDKTDTMKGSALETPTIRPKNNGRLNTKGRLSGWQMIRLSALGFEMERQCQGDDEDI